MNLSQFSRLQNLEIAKCPKLLPLSPLPWTSSPCHVLIKEVGSHFHLLDYQRNNQSEQGLQIEGKDGPLDSTFWKLLALSNLTELRELKMKKCPPLPLKHLKLLSALRRLSITDSGIALLPTDCESTVTYHFLVEQLEIYECSASGIEMTQLLSYFPKLMNLRIEKCQKITGLGVVGQEMMATLASPPSLSYNKSEDAQIGNDQQQPRGDNGIASVVTELGHQTLLKADPAARFICRRHNTQPNKRCRRRITIPALPPIIVYKALSQFSLLLLTLLVLFPISILPSRSGYY